MEQQLTIMQKELTEARQKIAAFEIENKPRPNHRHPGN
jgi:hypothetical protein